jgi:hypothetical protein
MILPKSPVPKFLIYLGLGTICSFLTFRERSLLSKKTEFGIKWRKIELFEGYIEIVFGLTGVIIFGLELMNKPVPETYKIFILSLGFLLLFAVAWTKDAFAKARNEVEEGNLKNKN